MAACQINVTGTTGSVLIQYTINLNNHKILGYIGDLIYIDTTSTNITYTNIDGNAIAASGCVTITNLPSTCYSINWETDSNYANCKIPKTFTQLKLGASTFTLNADYNKNAATLANNINTLNSSAITALASIGASSIRSTINNNIIIKVYGADIPEFKIFNVDGNHNLYIKAEVMGSCTIPVDYEIYSLPCPTENLN